MLGHKHGDGRHVRAGRGVTYQKVFSAVKPPKLDGSRCMAFDLLAKARSHFVEGVRGHTEFSG